MASSPAIDVALDVDLQPFCRLLQERGVPCRVFERAGRQVLIVPDARLVAPVQELYRGFLDGSQMLRREVAPPPRVTGPSALVWVLRAPLTLALIAGCALGALVVAIGSTHWQSLLAFQPFIELGGARIPQPESLPGFQWWRLWTPIFLHFGLLHLLFNAVFLWVFGARIEFLQGRGRLLLLVLLVGAGSNLVQFLYSPGVLFGGMSGVDAGLVGYCLGWSLRRPGEDFGVPRNIIVGLVGLMLLQIALTQVLALFGLHIAHAAHVSGFVIGCGMGLLLASLGRGGMPYR